MSLFQKIAIFFCCVVIVGTAYAIDNIDPLQQETNFLVNSEETPSYPLRQSRLDSYEDLQQPTPIDLKDPSNVRQVVEYDPATGLYFFRNQVGDMDIVTPFSMNEEEYLDYSTRESMRNYWQDKVRSETEQEKAKKGFSLTDMQFNIGAADKLFGPGGVQVKMQGSAELLFGFKINRIENPTLSVEARKPHPIFDFDQKIQLNINGKVGEKINFGMNYNTEASFDYDQSMIKLAYQGDEDDIIKSLEAGNVSLPLNSSLIRGSSALFGIKTEMQFGRLSVAAVVSQQETETKTVSLKNGKQTTRFDINADAYDENRHFFLSHFFRENFENSMSKLPYVNSGVQINRVEVWITNKKADFTQARNIVAFLDLGESGTVGKQLNSASWSAPTTIINPSNTTNGLYSAIAALPDIRNIQNVNSTLDTYSNAGANIAGGEDYEKVESARRLEPTEYDLNPQLGYISLKTQLNADEVLAVAYEYTYLGKVYQVGEFSSDNVGGQTGTSNQGQNPDPNNPNNPNPNFNNALSSSTLILKLLKGTNLSPDLPNWDLMMKNIYSLGAAQVEEDKFRLDVIYQSDSTGAYLNYLPEGNTRNQNLLRVMKLDRLDRNKALRPDGDFDFIDGFTINAQTGRIIFPVLEPFGSDLEAAIGDPNLAKKYIYQELYDSTKTTALEYSEKNKFRLKGEYRASTTSEIRLNAYNVPKGSVTVTAGGMMLTENIDYTVDYMMGTVNIINQSILESGSTIDVSMESQSMFSMQRKTLMGTHLEYQFNKDFSLGGTIMHLSEKPLTTKVNFGEEPISNTIWGLNANYKRESQWLTNMLDKIPILTAKTPSSLVVSGEFAHLIPGHAKVIGSQGVTYLDNFETSTSTYAIQYPYSWFLASTPRSGKFTGEANLSNNVDYGKNRALLSWYTIDPLFTRPSGETPNHIRNDKAQLSNHFVREIPIQEIFPNRELVNGQPEYLPVLNLAYYPSERGPYNLDVEPTTYSAGITSAGKLANPKSRWGGIMRRIDVPDFEAANIEFIEFWLMDPFVKNSDGRNGGEKGGDLYFNLGEISEDILRDGKKSFENGFDPNGDVTKMDKTVWGYSPKTQPVVNAFDNNESSRQYQDAGLNGLRTGDETTELDESTEFGFDTYKNYRKKYESTVSPILLDSLKQDIFSPLNDPAGDNYEYFRGSYWDNTLAGILDRYKRFNGMEGNSPVTTSTGNSFSSSSSTLPNVEDINQDNNLNEYEKYNEYKISLRPNDMVVGQNYIVDKVTSQIKLADGTSSEISWYQFKIPVRENFTQIGGGVNFKSVRFMRMYMTDFEEETFLRFGTMELVRGDWVRFKKPLYDLSRPPVSTGVLDVSTVSIEENATKKPVNYVLPPGIEREQDPSQTQIRQENEQSLLLKVTNLAPGDARGVFKNTLFDMRQFKRLQMFVHAEKFIDDQTDLNPSELTAFIRLGSDLTENYYEYEIPLQLTPEGIYNTNNENDRRSVWPDANTFDFPLSVLTEIKSNRNSQRRSGSVSFNTVYSEYDPEKPKNKVTVLGNPSLSEVQTIMIGVRNQSRSVKSGEIWVNELRLSGFNQDGGYAALANATLNLSDIGSVSVGGRIETVGFGGIEDNVLDRRMDDYTQFNVATNLELGRFFPEKAKLRLPMYYSYSQEVSRPKYDAMNQDLLLSEIIAEAESEAERDSISELSNTVFTTQSFNLTNMKVDIRSEKPMFYDPANISLNYAYSESQEHNPEVQRNVLKEYRGGLNYAYAFGSKPWEPFKNSKTLKKPAFRIIGDFNVYYLPASIGFNTSLMRQYNEKQLRNLNNPEIDYRDPYNPLLSNGKNFLWNKQFDLKYDLTKSIKLSFTTASNAQVEETKYMPVNKELFPTEYEHWKDTVWTSLRNGGVPLTYQQNFTLSWALPINKIPVFSWITSNFSYDGRYTWDRGPLTQEDEEAGRRISEMGNLATSLGTWQLDGRFNFEELYNKSSYLKSVNQKYSSRATSAQQRKVQRKIVLIKDKPQVFRHQLNSDKIKIVFTDTTGVTQRIAYKIVDKNSIEIQPTESNTITVNIEPSSGNAAFQLPVRFLMMFRNLSFNYVESHGMIVNGFMPEDGYFGQDGSAPGIPFAFGIQPDNWIQKAKDNKWLANNNTIIPISQTYTSDLTVKMLVEPFPGLKIDLAAARNYAEQAQVQYTFPNMPKTIGGSFSMTTIAVGTLFSKTGTIDNNYHSAVYETFKANRAKVYGILSGKYAGSRYPKSGFFAEGVAAQYAGGSFDPNVGDFSQNSADVLIPAFLSAYTGSSLKDMDLIPSFFKMLPNWRISYDGLMRVDWIKQRFKSVTLTHAYTCKYNVAGFTSYASWEGEGDIGFIPDVLTGNPVPSGMFDVPAVSITENFSPLVRVDMTLQNSVMLNAEYRTGRMLGLNIASTQLVESANNEFVIGAGYRIADFDLILKLRNDQEEKVKNDLTLRADLSFRKNTALIRKIDDDSATQATSGEDSFGLQFSAEYIFSSKMTFRAFYERRSSTPLISSSYPSTNTNFGISVKILLTR